MPPYHISTQASSTGGSFIVRESSHNCHRFTCARDDLSRPYPSAQDVYVRSNTYSSLEEFSDLPSAISLSLTAASQDASSNVSSLTPFVLGSYPGEFSPRLNDGNPTTIYWRQQWATPELVV